MRLSAYLAVLLVSTVHRPGDDPCKECDSCACARLPVEWLVLSILSAFAHCTRSLSQNWRCLTQSVSASRAVCQ